MNSEPSCASQQDEGPGITALIFTFILAIAICTGSVWALYEFQRFTERNRASQPQITHSGH